MKTAARKRPSSANRTKAREMKYAQSAPWCWKEDRRRSHSRILPLPREQLFGFAIRCGRVCRLTCELSYFFFVKVRSSRALPVRCAASLRLAERYFPILKRSMTAAKRSCRHRRATAHPRSDICSKTSRSTSDNLLPVQLVQHAPD